MTKLNRMPPQLHAQTPTRHPIVRIFSLLLSGEAVTWQQQSRPKPRLELTTLPIPSSGHRMMGHNRKLRGGLRYQRENLVILPEVQR